MILTRPNKPQHTHVPEIAPTPKTGVSKMQGKSLGKRIHPKLQPSLFLSLSLSSPVGAGWGFLESLDPL